MQFWLCLIDIFFYYYYFSRHSEWLPPTSHQVTNLRKSAGKIGEHILIHCWTEHWLLRTSNPLTEICTDIYLNMCALFPFQNKENWKCLLTSTNVSALCLHFDEVIAILQALHIRALMSRSSGKLKFDSSSWYVKSGLLRLCGDLVRVFFRKLHILYPSSRGPFSKYIRRKLCVYQYR